MMERGLNLNEIRYLLDHLAFLYRGPDLHDFLVTKETDISNRKQGQGVLLIPESNQKLDPENIITIEQVPVLFPCSKETEWYSVEGTLVRFHHDLLKSAFYLLSGYQEYVNGEKDAHGRYPWKLSIQHQLGVTGTPVVNYYFEVILEAFGKLCKIIGLPFDRTVREAPVLFLSHDVDRIRKYSLRNLAYVGMQLLKIKPDPESLGHTGLLKNLMQLLKGVLFHLKDPYWNFTELKELEHKNKISSTWFFLEKTSMENSRYHFRHKKIRLLIAELAHKGDEIGLHGTLESSEKPGILAAELQRLENVCDSPVLGIRQHFLKYSNPATTKIQMETRLLYDASLGFAEQIGFRNSYAWPFKLYDFKEQKSMDIWQLPLNAMDVTLLGYMQTPLPEFLEALHPVIQEVKKFKGVFSLLWHQCRLDEQAYPGIFQVYQSLLEEIMGQGFHSLTGEQVVVSFKSAGASGKSLSI